MSGQSERLRGRGWAARREPRLRSRRRARPEVARPLAARCAELGYDSMWSNDHPGAKGLETLAEFAAAAPGARPRRRRDRPRPHAAGGRSPPTSSGSASTPSRLWLGVGAGFSEKPLTRMRESLPELREQLPGVRLVLAAMGPKMCALAGAEYDGAFFNWMTPGFAAGAREQGRGRRPRGRPRDAAGLRLRPHRRRPRRRRAPGQGGVLLPRPPRRLPQPLRPPRRARGHRRRRRRRPADAQAKLAAYEAARHGRRPRPRQRQGRGDDRGRRGRGALTAEGSRRLGC